MEFFQIAILILFGLALSDLIVGVSNDAVNFLNSSIGSRVAPRHVIMIIASLGILAGVTFSSGMMEVARKGIFNPQFFTMPELMTVFLAVMLTDILLLDLYNTFGLPTSTTPMTSSPRCNNRCARAWPIKPAVPVTSTFIVGDLLSIP